MNCISCRAKSCRKNVSCGIESFDPEQTLSAYHRDDHQQVVQKSAQLVDGGRAGTLSRIEELIEFSKSMGYKRVGLAYCYGMEELAFQVRDLFGKAGVPTIGISCTVGAFSQREVNQQSDLPGVSCNPINQAAQMNAEGVDLAVVIGLCLGHDILFQKHVDADVTTLIVKDRVYNHNPLAGIEAMLE
jgi:uncharacterized metal-binding protein